VQQSVSGSHPGERVVAFAGRLEFSRRKALADAVDGALADAGVTGVVIDLSGATYLDSSVLGQLLLFKDRAKAVGKTITLQGARGVVGDVLRIAKFDLLFSMRD
jgi:anti-anti-sigma factor